MRMTAEQADDYISENGTKVDRFHGPMPQIKREPLDPKKVAAIEAAVAQVQRAFGRNINQGDRA